MGTTQKKNRTGEQHEPASVKKRRKNGRKNKKSFRTLIIVLAIICFAVAGGLLGAWLGIIKNAPALDAISIVPDNYSSIIYDSSGKEIDILHGKENREYAKLEEIPIDLQNAIVAIEDERFYSHNGIDFRSMVRAVVVDIITLSTKQGASTITQQLIKNEVLTSEKLLTRKLQEQYLAVKLEDMLADSLGSKKAAKDYILELYLNTIGLNHGLNGVKSAAKYYFGKDISELSLAECACIAGITKHPYYYSPISNPEASKDRLATVLSQMEKLGYITKEECDAASAEDIFASLKGSSGDDSSSGSVVHSYFVDALIEEIKDDLMAQKNISEQQALNLIYSGGLQIYSTVDMNMQNTMEESYKNDSLFPPKGDTYDATYVISVMDVSTEEQKHYSRNKTVTTQEEAEAFAEEVKAEVLDNTHTLVADKLTLAKSLQSAMSISDYRTGEVKALVGGRGEKTGNRVFNRATQALRQPGSCFKVLAAYAPAIDMGLLLPGSVLVDEKTTFEQYGWTPGNWWGSTYRGPATVRTGIKNSMNILAAKAIMMVGVENAFNYLENFGFTSLVRSKSVNGQIKTDLVPSIALGGVTDGVSVLELTAAYGAIANGGVYVEPHFYTKVLDHSGNTLLTAAPETRRVLKETTAFMLTDMMRNVISGGGTGGLANFSNMAIAGKTGTTTDDKDLSFAGYTPYYVAGIWMGYDIPKKMVYDKSYHLLLWKDVMSKIHSGLEYKNFSQPEGLTTVTLCAGCGKLPIDGLCENDYYGIGTVTDYAPVDFDLSSLGECTCHKTFTVDTSTGLLANLYCPASDAKDVVLAVDPETGKPLYTEYNVPEGKKYIDPLSSCTTHDAFNHGGSILGNGEKDPSQGVIGGDNPLIVNPYNEEEPE